MSTKIYTFEDMEKINYDISKIKKKEYLEDIRDIIIENNPKIKITENTNGLFVHFHNLTNNTYKELEKYIKNINNKKKKINNSNALSEYIPYSTDEHPFNKDNKMKYTSKEKILMKRNMYYKEINSVINDENNDTNPPDNDVQDNDIFIKKTKKNTKKVDV